MTQSDPICCDIEMMMAAGSGSIGGKEGVGHPQQLISPREAQPKKI
jgi:hypothetical protein